MKKNLRKLRLHRETLVLLDAKVVSAGAAGDVAFMTSCTEPCNCDTGCSLEVACQWQLD